MGLFRKHISKPGKAHEADVQDILVGLYALQNTQSDTARY